MEQVELPKSIFTKIAKVMSEVSRVPKNGYNSFHKYNYATESDLTESIRSLLFDAKLAFFSSVLEQDRNGEFTKVKMEFTLADTETGETIKSVYWGEGQDKGDKGLYKAYTGATKYFLMKTFLIPTGDDPEGDTGTDERNQFKNNELPYNQNNQSQNSGGVKLATEKQMKLIKRLLNDVAKQKGISEDEAYKTVQARLKKDLEWFTPSDASQAIGLLNNVLNPGT